MPLGFRREMAGVRNAQLILTRERAKLQEGELELSHQLAFAIRDMQANYVLSQTEFNRRIAAQREVETVTAAFETGTVTIDRVLDAQQKLARPKATTSARLINYNKSISQVHFRKGSLLEYNGVYLAEGPWPAKAYFDARGRARARDASTYLDYGFTQPRGHQPRADRATGRRRGDGPGQCAAKYADSRLGRNRCRRPNRLKPARSPWNRPCGRCPNRRLRPPAARTAALGCRRPVGRFPRLE